MKYKNKSIDNQSFNNEDFRDSEFVRCRFKKIKFNNVDLRYSSLRETSFTDTEFLRTKFTYSFFTKTCLDKFAVSFENVRLYKCNFNQFFTDLSYFKNCVFEICNFSHTNFGAATLENVKIIGDIKNCFFVPTGSVTRNGIINVLLNRYKTVNTIYKNVDLSEAKLDGVKFVGFDKSQIKFPKGDCYLYIDDLSKTYKSARTEVDLKWTGKEKEIGLWLLDNLYKPDLREHNAFIDSNYFKEDLDFRLFELLKEKTIANNGSCCTTTK